MTDRHDPEAEEREPRRVKVTDKRRLHAPATTDRPVAAGRRSDEASSAEAEGAAGEATLTSAAPGHVDEAASARGSGAPEDAPEAAGSTADLDRARAEAAEYLEHLQRLKAEFDNYRKRVLKEQTRAVELATEPMMRKLLEVLDEFELALVAAEQEPRFEKFVKGVEMVYAKLVDILRSEGLERIEADGQPFDPERHEALLQSDGDADGEPVVADVLRTGYTLRGRVIRPAGVKVGRR